MLPDFKLHNKSIIIKAVWYFHKTDTPTSGTEQSAESNLSIYGQQIFNKEAKNTQWEKDNLFNKWCWKTGEIL